MLLVPGGFVFPKPLSRIHWSTFSPLQQTPDTRSFGGLGLIQNGVLPKGSVLFWDEPETNLNPKLFGAVMDILLELQRDGVQMFMATHDYVILEEPELHKGKEDTVAFHSL